MGPLGKNHTFSCRICHGHLLECQIYLLVHLVGLVQKFPIFRMLSKSSLENVKYSQLAGEHNRAMSTAGDSYMNSVPLLEDKFEIGAQTQALTAKSLQENDVIVNSNVNDSKIELDLNLDSESEISTCSSSSRAKTWICEYEGCNKAFSRPSQLTQHQETVHRGIKAFKCPQCDRSFARKSHLERHLVSHSEEKPFSCSVCNKGFTTRQQLRRHEITHTKSFQCPYENCSESFYKHPQLRSHILSVHLQKLTCEHCGKKFQRPYRLRAHIDKHHNPDSVYKYQCTHSSCFEAFKTWTALQQHIKEHHPKLSCPICSKACVGESGLAMHMKIHDTSTVIKNWKCERCPDLFFAKKADLISHYMEHHEELVSEVLEKEKMCQKFKPSELPTTDSTKSKRSRKSATHVHNNELESIQTEVTLRKYLETGKSSVSLLHNSAGRKLKCHYPKCYRTFKTQERYDLHVQKHKIHELKLKILQERECEGQKAHLDSSQVGLDPMGEDNLEK
ncbi:LAME_0F20054g1_1 [Lachancea meyersii CBS 8951]|uniref:Transcription factor IIIA n=1 Tax=Lachancea meyersii CBS 8951 TaxID=1266667 RepID=A0A1G4K1W8_9SACH|nr:LAME_0F20054g1_1 [Lachancea meyersii CBS 8951]